MARRNIEAEIERLCALRGAPASEAVAAFRKALGARANLLVARAARLAGEMQLRDLVPDLLEAFDRLLDEGAGRDPQCWGKNAIAKALVDLDYRDSAPFLRGMVYVQMEAVWGRHEDMAQNLRGVCLLALAACTDLSRGEILRRLVDSLADPASTVRIEALRALEQMEGDECALVLRLKARLGDEEPSVTGQAFDSLLALERGRAFPFVAGFLETGAIETQAEAALALGTSRLPETVALLHDVLSRPGDPRVRPVLFRALGLTRDDAAVAYLRSVAAAGPPGDAAAAVEALALCATPSTPAPPSR
jgi:HEAT repeat protein